MSGYSGSGSRGNSGHRFWVDGLLPECEDVDVRNYFSQFGRVVEASVAREKDTSLSRCFATVVVQDEQALDKILTVDHHIWGATVETMDRCPSNDERPETHGPAPPSMPVPPPQPLGILDEEQTHEVNGQEVKVTKRIDLPRPPPVKRNTPDFGSAHHQYGGGGSQFGKPILGDVEPGKFFVGSLAQGTTEEDLRAYFSSLGEVTETSVVRDRVTGGFKNCAFVTFVSASEDLKQRLMQESHIINSSTIRVEEARQKKGYHKGDVGKGGGKDWGCSGCGGGGYSGGGWGGYGGGGWGGYGGCNGGASWGDASKGCGKGWGGGWGDGWSGGGQFQGGKGMDGGKSWSGNWGGDWGGKGGQSWGADSGGGEGKSWGDGGSGKSEWRTDASGGNSGKSWRADTSSCKGGQSWGESGGKGSRSWGADDATNAGGQAWGTEGAGSKGGQSWGADQSADKGGHSWEAAGPSDGKGSYGQGNWSESSAGTANQQGGWSSSSSGTANQQGWGNNFQAQSNGDASAGALIGTGSPGVGGASGSGGGGFTGWGDFGAQQQQQQKQQQPSADIAWGGQQQLQQQGRNDEEPPHKRQHFGSEGMH